MTATATLPTTLKNGATVLDRRPLPSGPGSVEAEIVLCNTGGHHPFVTWLHTIEDDACCWGHYFEKEEAARADFRNRAV